MDFTDKDAASNGSKSKLKLLAITGDLSNADVQMFVRLAPKLQHLCLRSSPLSHFSSMIKQSALVVDFGQLSDLRALDLGFPHLTTSYNGL